MSTGWDGKGMDTPIRVPLGMGRGIITTPMPGKGATITGWDRPGPMPPV